MQSILFKKSLIAPETLAVGARWAFTALIIRPDKAVAEPKSFQQRPATTRSYARLTVVSELIAFVFRDQYRAPEVLNELRRRDWPWVRDFDDAITITINDEGKARAQVNVDLSTCEATRWARLWGSFLNITLFLPLAELMIEATDGIVEPQLPIRSLRNVPNETIEAHWWQESLEHAENFKRDVGALLGPNGSAIFALLRQTDASNALRHLQNYGDTIVHTTISSEQQAKMNRLLQSR